MSEPAREALERNLERGPVSERGGREQKRGPGLESEWAWEQTRESGPGRRQEGELGPASGRERRLAELVPDPGRSPGRVRVSQARDSRGWALRPASGRAVGLRDLAPRSWSKRLPIRARS